MFLGKLLKRKAKAGVNVLVLLWDEDSRLQTIPSFREFIQSAADTKTYFKGVFASNCNTSLVKQFSLYQPARALCLL